MASVNVLQDKAGHFIRKRFAVSELLPHAHQFAETLTKQNPEFTYDELKEDFGAMEVMHKGQGRVLVIFKDNSCVEFFFKSVEIIAHEPAVLEKVISLDSRLWAKEVH